MSDPVKEWNYDKPFKRINNDAFRPQNKPDGDGVSRGCQLPSQYPDRVKDFDKAFEDFKPGELQKVIETAHSVVKGIGTAINIALVILQVASAGAGTIAKVTAGQAIQKIIEKVLDIADKEIKELLKRIGRKLVDRALRVIPQWVPILEGASNEQVTADQVVEVEGLALRSFQDPIDVPFRQWHLWFDWNVYVIPEPDYRNVMSPAHNPPNDDELNADDDESPLVPEGIDTIEVQWDSGALWRADIRATMERGFNEPESSRLQTPDLDGPMHRLSWAWPQKDSYVWAAGRWVYDCSRTTSTKTSDPLKMCAMLNPCKAIATARWQAFQFRENKFPVPAIQFVFFACKRGGYIDYPSIQDQDYEFIVDLPKIEGGPRAPFPVGHTPDFAHNTIVLRPRLLKDVNPNPFNWAGNTPIEPIVEVVRPDDPQQMPLQVKVKVPLTKLAANAEASGFILSLGWFDPFFEQAKKVKQCTLTVTKLSGRRRVRDSISEVIRRELGDEEQKLINKIRDEVGQIPVAGTTVGKIPILSGAAKDMAEAVAKKILDFLSPLSREEWVFRIGVNGQWHALRIDGMTQTDKPLTLTPPIQFDVLLSEDDMLRFSVNGADFDPVGAMMRDPAPSRFLKLDGKQFTWKEIVTPDPDPTEAQKIRLKMAIEYSLRLLALGTAGFGLAVDNQPLGFLDPLPPRTGPPLDDDFEQDPFVLSRTGDVFAQSIEKKPFFALATPQQKILVESLKARQIGESPDADDTTSDYSIFYDLSVKRLKIPKTP